MENEKVIKLEPNHLTMDDSLIEKKESCDDCTDCACDDTCTCEKAEHTMESGTITESLKNSVLSYSEREIELLLAILTKPEQLQAMYPGLPEESLEALANAYRGFYGNIKDILQMIFDRFVGEDVSIIGDAMVVLQALASLNPLSPVSGLDFEWEVVPMDSQLFSELKNICGSKWPEDVNSVQHNSRLTSVYRFNEDNNTAFRLDGIVFRTREGDRINEDSIMSVEFPYEGRPPQIQIVPDEQDNESLTEGEE